MRDKTLIYGLGIFFFLTAFAYAQEWPSAENVVEKMRTGLNLDQDQYDQVKVIVENNMDQRKEIEQESAQGVTSMSQSQSLDTELYVKLSEVLTEYQMEQWDKIFRGIVKNIDASAVISSKDNPISVN